MRALVAYESMFGNTEEVARAIAAGIADSASVDAVEIASLPQLPAAVDLLVIGGPTHALGMSRQSTRDDAATRGPLHNPTAGSRGMREFIDSMSKAPESGLHLAATFDTRADKARVLPGHASRGAAKRLRRLGYDMVGKPESFYVEDIQGPLDAGELGRAKAWGQQIAAGAAILVTS